MFRRRQSAQTLPDRSRSPIPSANEKIAAESYLREIYESQEADVDIVAVHGLNLGRKETHGEDTWTAKNDVLWLREFLPERIPTARLLLFGYNSRVAFSTSTAGIADVAVILLNRLLYKRKECSGRPIVFLCHSLGGIIVKQALVRAIHGTAYESIRQNTRGIAFFGTPHGGGHYADLGRVMASIATAILGNVKNNFLESLQANSSIAEGVQELFMQQVDDYHIISFYETKPLGKLGLIVEKKSATLGLRDSVEIKLGVSENHSNICKFESRNDNYELVIENLVNLIEWAKIAPNRLKVSPNTIESEYSSMRPRRSHGSFGSASSGSEDGTSTSKAQFLMPTLSIEDTDPPLESKQTRHGISIGSPASQPKPPFFIIPYSQNVNFIGREDIIEQVKSALQQTSRSQKGAVLSGLGGVGKSQAAIAYVYWYRGAFPDHSVFWINASSSDRFRQALLEVGAECGIPGFDNPQNDRFSLLRNWLQYQVNHSWLMIIDGADDIDTFSKGGQENMTAIPRGALINYIPNCDQGRIIVTTRDVAVAMRLFDQVPLIKVEKLSTSESVLMLRQSLLFHKFNELPEKEQEDDHFERLAKAMDGLPLALAQAAAYIRETLIGAEKYLSMLENDSVKDDLLNENFYSHGRDPEMTNAVYLTWRRSFDQIRGQNPEAADLLSILAQYEQQNIPESLLEHSFPGSPINFGKALGTLMRLSLVERGSENSYNIHRLVQLCTKQWLKFSSLEVHWLIKALETLSIHFPSGDPETWVKCRLYRPHAMEIIRSVSTLSGESVANLGVLQEKLSWYLHNIGEWDEAESMARNACQNLETAYGIKNEKTLKGKGHLAYIIEDQCKYEEAEKLASHVVEEWKSLLGSTNEQTLAAYLFLSRAYQNLGKLGPAEKAARTALSGFEKTLSSNHVDIFYTQQRLGRILELQGKYDRAEQLFLPALAGLISAKGPSDHQTLYVRRRLIYLQRAQGHYEAAESTAREILKIRMSTLGLSHPETRKTQYVLALTLIPQSKIPEAEVITTDLMDYIDNDRHLSHNSLYRLSVLFALACIRTAQNRHSEAAELHGTVLSSRKEWFAANNPDVLDSQSALGSAVLAVDPTDATRIKESYTMQHSAYKLLRKNLGSRHPMTLTSVQRLSEVLFARGDLKQSLKLAKKVQKEREKILTSGHPDIAMAADWVRQLESQIDGKAEKRHSKREGTQDPNEIVIKQVEGAEKRGFFGRQKRSSVTKEQKDEESTIKDEEYSETDEDVEKEYDDETGFLLT